MTATPHDDRPPALWRAALVYTALRVGLFLGVWGVLVALGAPSLTALVVALGVGVVGSLVLLRRQRDDLARALVASRERSHASRSHEQRVRDHVAQTRRERGEDRS